MSAPGKIAASRLLKQRNPTNTGTVIFLHGSGDTGRGLLDWVNFLLGDATFPHLKVLFPTAPLRPYTPLGGELSNVWFDRLSVTPDVPEHSETLESIGREMRLLIESEVDSGVPLERIVVGGFSMGGALALHSAYRFVPGLGGAFALSSFLNRGSVLYEHLESERSVATTPLYMCHGERDALVPLSWGRETFDKLEGYGVKGEFIALKNAMHELKAKELQGLWKWLSQIVPEGGGDA